MTGKRRRGHDESGPPPGPSGPPVQPFATVRRQTRRDLREDRHRRHRRVEGIVGGAAVVVLAVILLAVLGVRAGGHRSAAAGRTQTTALVQLRDPDGTAGGSVLIAHDTKEEQGAEVLVPSRLIGEVCGFGTQQFGDVLRLPNGPSVARGALSSVMGVTVDGSWVLDQGAFTRLVDRLGGVSVDGDVDVLRSARGGGSVVVVPQGRNERLDGQRALAFATYVAPAEDQAAQLARLQQVVDAVVAALPKKTADVAALVQGLGGGSDVSMPLDRLAGVLTGFAADARSNNATFTVLPVVPIDTGGGATTYRVDAARVRQLAQTQFAASIPAGGSSQPNRVFIQNGVGRPGLVESACDRLVHAGFAFAGSGNAPSFNYPASLVLVDESTPAAADLGQRVAAVLGLPAGDVKVAGRGQNVADVQVILGGDYKP